MINKLLVIFGLPGAGKSYVANILGKQFGYHVYDGDTDIPNDMREALHHKDAITDVMRRNFLNHLIASVSKAATIHEKLTVNQAFIKHFMQKEFLDAFPNAIFLYVTAKSAVREKRYMNRNYFNLGLPYLRHMSSLFESPKIPHLTIINNVDGSEEIVAQLKKILQ